MQTFTGNYFKINRFLLVFGIATLALVGCSSNPHKAEKIDTKIEKEEHISGDSSLGVKDGNMVVQTKVKMGEELRVLQNEVYEQEDKVYGNRKYGSKGLYGVLKDCKVQLADKRNGGDGKLMWTEPIDRVTDKEEEFKIGLDDEDKIVGVSDEFLKDRLARFRNYKVILQKREDEYDDKLAICRNELKNRKYESEKGTTEGK